MFSEGTPYMGEKVLGGYNTSDFTTQLPLTKTATSGRVFNKLSVVNPEQPAKSS